MFRAPLSVSVCLLAGPTRTAERRIGLTTHGKGLAEAERVLQVITEWGRYAEIFAFDTHSAVFSLENPGGEKKRGD